jgi:hypothetical protein
MMFSAFCIPTPKELNVYSKVNLKLIDVEGIAHPPRWNQSYGYKIA